MGRYGVTLGEMKESTRALFRNQREQARNKRKGNTISNIQQHEKQVENQSQPSLYSFHRTNREFDAGLFLILTTITNRYKLPSGDITLNQKTYRGGV